MCQLFVEVYSVSEEEAEVPVQTAICLFLITYLKSTSSLSLILVTNPEISKHSASLTVSLAALQYHTADCLGLKSPVSDCYLPVFTSAGGSSCVAGFCAILRQVVKNSGEQWCHLLGFREGCLFACAEVSLWTKFCEIDVIKIVHDILLNKKVNDIDVYIPEHLARFEEHLKQPVRMHNVDKLRKRLNQDSVDHNFAEGYAMSLADLIIVPCIHLFLQARGSETLPHRLPAMLRWYYLVLGQHGVSEALQIIQELPSQVGLTSYIEYVLPEVPKHSLYKSDPKRYKPKLKQFTRQEDVEAALGVIEELGIHPEYDEEPFGHEIPLDWQTVPRDTQPDVPPSRLARKQQQLENLSRAIIKLAKKGDIIVDFCCGSGHLGILLAHCLPECHVVLLDNKEESMTRAKARVKRLSLTNVTTIQCNLDYFKGSFQIGASLHACGVASDLVIHSCLQREAAFVVCPCCYGSLQANHSIKYPQSVEMSSLSPRHYLVLGHCADQTHKLVYDKTAQGEQCMAIVDFDRCLLAKGRGYSVSLTKLIPQTCSPKNNLLVGIPQALTLRS